MVEAFEPTTARVSAAATVGAFKPTTVAVFKANTIVALEVTTVAAFKGTTIKAPQSTTIGDSEEVAVQRQLFYLAYLIPTGLAQSKALCSGHTQH
jgi:hypothetical protein